jgi:hypothetical protein
MNGLPSLGWEHIGLTGDCVWAEHDHDAPFRPLREPRAMVPALAACSFEQIVR